MTEHEYRWDTIIKTIVFVVFEFWRHEWGVGVFIACYQSLTWGWYSAESWEIGDLGKQLEAKVPF